MARIDRILTLDIGASSIKAGEFEYPTKDRVRLINYAYREYDEELTEANRYLMIAGGLRQMLQENAFSAKKAHISISGQSAFTRFVKLPMISEDESQIKKIVEFEARQNVPFPMDEVIWDYQLISNPESDELEVMFVVIKNEIVEQITSAVQSAGIEVILVDVAPAACYNSARRNRVGNEKCSLIVNIGCRSTSLLFADGGRFFARTIPIAGHSITQQIAKEFGIGFTEAEELKRRHGFVALGGAYEEPDSEVAAQISKIIRNVMARLHAEINRSINVYRQQQKGSKPEIIHLTGGSSTMAYTDHFFAEKLRMEVRYLNPMQVTGIGANVDKVDLQEKAHMFSEVVGLALRRLRCPVEVNLIPAAIRAQEAFKKKKMYFAASILCLLLAAAAAFLTTERKRHIYARNVTDFQQEKNDKGALQKRIESVKTEVGDYVAEYDKIGNVFKRRSTWPVILNEIENLRPANLWIVKLKPIRNSMMSGITQSTGYDEYEDESMFGGFGGGDYSGGMESTVPVDTLDTSPIVGIEIVGHAVTLKSEPGAAPLPEEKTKPELTFLNRLKESELIDEEGGSEPALSTFVNLTNVRNLSQFTIRLKLKQQIEFN